MSRKFNTKKFIKDVLNDKYALVIGNEIIFDTKEPTDHQRTAMQSVAEVLFYSSFGAPLLLHRSFPSAVKKMASYSHTLPCCVSQLRSSLEASKKQLRVWLQYVCGVTEMLLYPAFRVPLGSFCLLMVIRRWLVMGSKWYTTGNTCSSGNEAGFVPSRTSVHRPMNLWPLRNKNKKQDTSITL